MTIKYMEGFPDGAFEVPPYEPPAIDPNHISFVDGKFYLGGVEIPAEQGEPLLDKAIQEGGNYGIFMPIRRN